MILLSILMGVTLVLLIWQPVRIEIVALGLIATLGLTGLLGAAEALSGFSNPATLTVAAMLVLSAGLERAGVVDYVGGFLAQRARGGVTGLLILVAVPTALFSAFMNNTAIVALMIPVALTLSRQLGIAPSKLLIPISYISIFGGTCTLIGTSTNILVDSLYRQAGGPGFGMFEFSGLGLIYLLVGGAFVVLMLPRMLPKRTALAQLMEGQEQGHFVTEVCVPEGSSLVGRQLKEVFGTDKEIRVLELIRDEEARLGPPRDTVVEANDILLVEGTARTIHKMLTKGGVVQGTAVSDRERVTISRIDLRMVEAVITPNSRFLHQKVQELGLSRRLGIGVLAIRRLGRHHQYNLRELQLHSGDVLLLQGEREPLRSLQEEGEVLLIEGVEQTLTFPRKAPLAIGILVAVVALAAANVAPIVLLAFAGVGLMMLTGCLTLSHVTRALDPGVLFLLAGMIPLGLAMESSGLAGVIAGRVVDFSEPYGPLVLIAAIYLLTSLLTEVVSNNAAAVLLVPICLGIAAELGVDPKPLLIAVTFGASASFATPIGYQTNTMVMGPGGYLFRDFLKVGIPMNVLMFLTATVFIPLIWPLW
ncbi:MAG: SLC13 family permease [Verrucomicrobia bacterium]|nr:SLC13 family permease [Verrucomicrobiota bacterium]